MPKYPLALQQLIQSLKFLPGVGSKTAERFAFTMLNWPQDRIFEFSQAVIQLKEMIVPCPECHCLMENNNCHFCDLDHRNASVLCIVSSPKDVYAIEETRSYKGLYHVLGALLSPLDGRSLQKMNLGSLMNRLDNFPIQEVIIALDSTLEGDATALYLKEQMIQKEISISRLALGLPMDSSLEYIDENTLNRAFVGRHTF